MSSLETVPLAESIFAPIFEERSLAEAFASFTEAAASLERCYSQLQQEVVRLRQELEETNRELTESLEGHRRTREQLHRILEGLPCGVLVLKAEGEVAVINPKATAITGASCGEKLPPLLQDVLERNLHRGGELEYYPRDGVAECISIHRAQLGSEDGNSSVFILEDVTALRRLQREHETFLRRQALAELSALLAHEIRNPLGSMELFAGLLAESELSRDQREWIACLLAGLRTLGATVNNVLNFHSSPQLQTTRVDPEELLEWLSAFLEPMAARSNVRVALKCDLQHAVIEADRHRLEQVLLNLGLNALRFMPDGGQLTIAGRADDHAVYVAVSDTGSGIAPEFLERIFQPGFTTTAGSPGLGLAVCKRVVEQHRGTIRVASSAGCGTTFILELPKSCL